MSEPWNDKRSESGEPPRFRFIPDQVIATGPAEVLDPLPGLLPELELIRLERRPLPGLDPDLMNCEALEQLLPALRRCLATTAGQPWATDLYRLGSGRPVGHAVAQIRNLKLCALADPNYVTGDPWSVAGSPWSVAGSPWSVAGSPYVRPGVLATEVDFWAQWALGDGPGLGRLAAGGQPPTSVTGAGVRVGVFDTCPFDPQPAAGPQHMPLNWVTPPLDLNLSFPPFFAAPPVAPGSPDVRDHGLFVCGLVHAVAPACDLHLFRVLDEHARGDLFSLNLALLHFIDQVLVDRENASIWGAVINLSLGIGQPEGVAALELILAIAHCHGLAIVAAAGNDSWGAPQPEPAQVPASYDFVTGVQASNVGRGRACFSNQGDVAAPGCALISLVNEPGYRLWSGSSFATPLVSGAAALILEQHTGQISARAVANRIKTGACPSPDGTLPNGILHLPACLLGTPCPP
jgi:hypothetical protein